MFGPAASVVDRDDRAYFAVDDLAAYAQATLQLWGAERRHPYQPDQVAAPVARRIAELADRTSLSLGWLPHPRPIRPAHRLADQLRVTPSVADALSGFLRSPPAGRRRGGGGPVGRVGLRRRTWRAAELVQIAVHALTGHSLQHDRLREFAHASAANFLVETTRQADPVYRLFHQALNDTLTDHRPDARGGHAALTRAFIAEGRRCGWDRAPAYLLRSLPDHARHTGLVDELITETDYTLHADLRRLIPASTTATTPAGRLMVSLLHRTPAAIDADPAHRLALFSVTEALDTPDTTAYRDHRGPGPYRAAWAHVIPRDERAILTGHTGMVSGVCAVRVGDRDLVASASADRTVRLWDPATGHQLRQLTGHTSRVNEVCAIRVGDRDLLASASADGTVRLWDPATGHELRQLTGHTNRVNEVCAIRVGDRDLLASASDDGTVRLWDPATGHELRQLTGHTNRVRGVCVVRVGDRDLLASASDDHTVRLWIWPPAANCISSPAINCVSSLATPATPAG